MRPAPLPELRAQEAPLNESALRQPLDPTVVRVVKTPLVRGRRSSPRPIGLRWQDSVAYAFRAFPFLLGPAVVLTILSGGAVLLLPKIDVLVNAPWWFLLLCLPGLLVPIVLAGYGMTFLHCVLCSAVTGAVGHIPWPGKDLALVLKCVGIWLGCFLIGPVAPALFAFWYWLRCGDPGLLDWLIVAEFGVLSIAWWLYGLLAVASGKRLRDTLPHGIMDLVSRCDYGVLATVLATSGVLLGHGFLVVLALEKLHDSLAVGITWLAGTWLSALLFATFLFRLLGVHVHLHPPVEDVVPMESLPNAASSASA